MSDKIMESLNALDDLIAKRLRAKITKDSNTDNVSLMAMTLEKIEKSKWESARRSV